MSYEIFKVIHILILSAWLGLEVAVFILFYRHRDAEISIEGRRALAEVHEPIAIGPRVLLIPMVMVGLALANIGQWGFTGASGGLVVIASAILGAAWLGALAYMFWVRRNLPEKASHLARVKLLDDADTWSRVLLVAGLATVAIVSIAGGEIIKSNWLAWKVLVVAGVASLTLVWKHVDSNIAIERRIAVGANPEEPPTEARFTVLTRLTYQAQVLLVSFWVLMIVIVWLAVAKP